ncbi:hypothetical protein GQ607_004097 [Colletotrichum asianum]|uniref:Uncharacterized protein n=1 Tax=Colletotrichum asianum TaxID=702518 RepID=A0A8H3WLD5_9PEZI|nr:hypothetical protein GQ607_004097 [Colletotrichum asianum]
MGCRLRSVRDGESKVPPIEQQAWVEV